MILIVMMTNEKYNNILKLSTFVIMIRTYNSYKVQFIYQIQILM